MEPPLPSLPDWDEATRLSQEKAVLGFYLSGHPLESQKPLLRDLAPCTTLDLQEREENAFVALAGTVASSRVIADKKGKPMAFVKLEDFVGTAELLVFSSVYERFASLLADDSLVVVVGRTNVREEQETKLVCEQVFTLDDAVRRLGRRLDLMLDASQLSPEDLGRLRQRLASSPGSCEVRLHVSGTERTVEMRSRNTQVTPSRELVDELRRLLGEENVRLHCDVSHLQSASNGQASRRGPGRGARPGAGSAGVDSRPPW
jgi:DNA polymerase-3 subunit alpha